jgi:hypothetical protein
MDSNSKTCNELKDENEIAIIEKYSCSAKRYTIVLSKAISILLYLIFKLAKEKKITKNG